MFDNFSFELGMKINDFGNVKKNVMCTLNIQLGARVSQLRAHRNATNAGMESSSGKKVTVVCLALLRGERPVSGDIREGWDKAHKETGQAGGGVKKTAVVFLVFFLPSHLTILCLP